ncbi:universal stress protein [Algoriphagus winogradskyi]|uniref:Nucleotide-binding universal stress protein, UspA family n=1 Tax=Algoriphagus winogradskyi TaxID=237017 RepID=A0ABY1NG93_9BACT|nr:universal stress protein [Algoriphagus winogradskyi]SMP07121.1 Nucleotide-binding universal stress protein, UspA family [Algoriphagus winogradskyi]
MKKILVPFDFSSYSVVALKTAQKISAKSGAEILCVTVIPSEVDWELLSDEAKKNYPDLIEEFEEAQEVLPDYILKIAPAKAPIRQIVRIGVPNELILRVVQEENPDMLVLGAYGKGYEEGNFIGSTLQRVLRKSNCPVLAVKEPLGGNDFRKVVFASNFEPKSKVAFEKIKPLIKLFKSTVHLLFVNIPAHFTSTQEITSRMDWFKKGHEELTFYKHIFNDTEVEKGMIAFAETQNIKWLILVTGDHSLAPSYLVETTETLIFKSGLGVLSVKS